MAQIRNIKDKDGNVFYPLTHERAVKDSNGVNLETKLAELNSRPYDLQNPNGMGYLVLEKDKSFASQVTAANTIYEIRYDFDLNNTSVTIPAGCVLKFEGGSLSNGLIFLSDNDVLLGRNASELIDVSVSIVGENVVISKIDSESAMLRPAFEHPTAKNNPTDCSGLVIEDCRITSSGDGSANSGVAITLGFDYEENLVVENLTFRNNTIKHGAMGIEIRNHYHSDPDYPYGTNTDELRVQNIIIENNYIENIVPDTTYGFCISLSGRGNNARVLDNTLINGRLGLEIVGHFGNVDVVGNKIQATIARESFTDCSATADEKTTGIRYIGNTFTSVDDASRCNINFINISKFEFSNNYVICREIRFNGVEDSEVAKNVILGMAGYNILFFKGTISLRVKYNYLANKLNAYIFNLSDYNGINPSGNVITGNTFTMGGNSYPPNRGSLFPDNLFYDNFDLRIGKTYGASGPSNSRPTVYLPIGFRYFDTDLQRNVMWSGSSLIGDNGWIDEDFTIQANISLPVTIPRSGAGGLLIIQGTSGEVSMFIVRYYVVANSQEITSNNRYTVSRTTAGGNITISPNDPDNTEQIKYRFFTFGNPI